MPEIVCRKCSFPTFKSCCLFYHQVYSILLRGINKCQLTCHKSKLLVYYLGGNDSNLSDAGLS